jgi:hypothetical protein
MKQSGNSDGPRQAMEAEALRASDIRAMANRWKGCGRAIRGALHDQDSKVS